MSRDKNLANIFDKLQSSNTVKDLQKTSKKSDDIKDTSKKDDKDLDKPVLKNVQKDSPDTSVELKKDESDLKSNPTENPFGQDIIEKFNEKRKKPTIEDTHVRNTVFIRNDLHERLHNLTNKRRGLKTLLINEALEAILDVIEGKNK